MKPGTKNLLIGDHQLLLHPLFVALAWWKLFGFPRDVRLWVCFFLHDLGYWGRNDIDGADGRNHPEVGANIAHWLFDRKSESTWWAVYPPTWYEFCLYHSRYYAKKEGHPVSALALADKYAFVLTPRWLFMLLSKLSGGLEEYLRLDGESWGEREWHRKAQAHAWNWVDRTMSQPVRGRSGYYTSWEKGH